MAQVRMRHGKAIMASESTAMEKRVLGKTGMKVTVLGFGGAEIGIEGAAYPSVEILLNSALDAGMNAVDTAECYETSEEMIGKAIGQRRRDFFLFTKCGHASGFDLPDWNPRMLEMQIERSLQRLRVEYVDLLQIHSCSQALLEQGEVIEVVQNAKASGKTRFIGYSGDGTNAAYAIQTGVFDVLQTSVNIADQQVLDRVLPLAVERNMGVIAKRPIANAAWKTGKQPVDAYHHEYWRRLEELQYGFLQGDLPNAVSTALRFTLAQPGVTTAIVGTANPKRWAENARMLDTEPLDPVQIQAIRDRWRAVAKPDWVGQN